MMISIDYKDRIKNYLGKQFNLPAEQALSMLPEFLVTLSDHMLRLEDALQEESLLSLARAGHTIKGAFLNLGLSEFADLALQIELGARNSDNTLDYQNLVGKLRRMLDELLNQ